MSPVRYIQQTWSDNNVSFPTSAARMSAMETGIFNASSAVIISDSTLGGATASFDITSITNTFSHLLLMAVLRGDQATFTNQVLGRFNNDSAANYDYQSMLFFAATSSNGENFAQTSLLLGGEPAASASAGLFSYVEMFIPHYTGTTANKVVQMRSSNKYGTATQNLQIYNTAGFWRSSSAINRITLLPASGNFVSGSRCTLYGLA